MKVECQKGCLFKKNRDAEIAFYGEENLWEGNIKCERCGIPNLNNKFGIHDADYLNDELMQRFLDAFNDSEIYGILFFLLSSHMGDVHNAHRSAKLFREFLTKRDKSDD